MPKTILADAPVRADLAGGTLDLWPLGLFHEGSVTVAVAVSLRVQAQVRAAAAKRARVRAVDLEAGRSVSLTTTRVTQDKLELLERLVRQLAPRGGVDLATRSPVRAGSGLGTSSALGVAVAAALMRFTGAVARVDKVVPLVRDIEAQILGIPTGTQDHEAAWRGGIVIVEHRPGGGAVRRVSGPLLRALGSRLVLVDSVQARSSGPSNWDMYRRRIEADRAAVKALEQVARAGREAAEAILAGDWRALGRAMNADLQARRGWSSLVVTPAFERIFAAAHTAGAMGAKVCGAGGGGFGVVLAAPERRARVVEAIEKAGGVVSEAGPTARGLRLQQRG
jgi:D-glycero-alpha-D-manno-heptose-7-phosphate kinase